MKKIKLNFHKKELFSVLILLLASLIWGLAFSAQKDASDLGGFTVGAVRNLFAVIFLAPIIPLMDRLLKNGRGFYKPLIEKETSHSDGEESLSLQEKWRRRRRRGRQSSDGEGKPRRILESLFDFTRAEIIGGAISGFFMTFATALQQNGIGEGTDAGKAGFITALYVVIVPIYALLFGKKSPPKVWVSIGIAVIGFYLLSVKNGFSIELSDLLILLCAFIFAAQIMAVDIFSPRCDGVRLSIIQFATGFVLNAIFALILEGPIDFSGIGDNILSLLYLGVFSSGIAYTLQVIGQRNLNPGVASILLSLESVFGAIGGAIIFSETMEPREIIGCVIVFSAVVLSQIDIKKTTQNPEDL